MAAVVSVCVVVSGSTEMSGPYILSRLSCAWCKAFAVPFSCKFMSGLFRSIVTSCMPDVLRSFNWI